LKPGFLISDSRKPINQSLSQETLIIQYYFLNLNKTPAIMSKHTLHFKKEVFYFITITCYKWINLINKTDLYPKIYDWFDILTQNSCFISAYVLMPNHFHFLLFQSEESPQLNKLVANGKRFLAYKIIERLKMSNDYRTLKYLAYKVAPREKRIGKRHQAFQPSFDARICYSDKMTKQKVDYIHRNPVSKKWHLANSYLDYEHSSAWFYEYGELVGYGNLKHYREI
ncbi:transposase, partial [Bacteroidota bacterium]